MVVKGRRVAAKVDRGGCSVVSFPNVLDVPWGIQLHEGGAISTIKLDEGVRLQPSCGWIDFCAAPVLT